MLDKSIRNDWQIRVYLLSKCLVDFRRQQLLIDFWGGRMGDFRKKYNCRLISRGKSLQGYTLYVGTIISCTGKKYCSWWIQCWEKILNSYTCMSGKKIKTWGSYKNVRLVEVIFLDLIGKYQNKRFYIMEIILSLMFAGVSQGCVCTIIDSPPFVSAGSIEINHRSEQDIIKLCH